MLFSNNLQWYANPRTKEEAAYWGGKEPTQPNLQQATGRGAKTKQLRNSPTKSTSQRAHSYIETSHTNSISTAAQAHSVLTGGACFMSAKYPNLLTACVIQQPHVMLVRKNANWRAGCKRYGWEVCVSVRRTADYRLWLQWPYMYWEVAQLNFIKLPWIL